MVGCARELLQEPLEAKFNILVPVNGNELSHAALPKSRLPLRAPAYAPVTALYVALAGEGRKAFATLRRSHPQRIVSKLAETYDIEIRTAVRVEYRTRRSDPRRNVTEKQYNLVVIGAGRRPGEKLFFGDTAAALLEKSERSLLFVAS